MMVQPWHWFVFGIILIIAEIYTATFAILWFGIAALIVAVMLWIAPEAVATWQSQTLVWVIMSLFSAIFWFKFAQPVRLRVQAKKALESGILIGETGMIVKPPISSNSGTYHPGIIRFNVPKFGIDEWDCYDVEGTDSTLKMGNKVIVVDMIDSKLMVKLVIDT